MSAIAANPELQRNCRIQLRRSRMIACAVISAAVSLSLITINRFTPSQQIRDLFTQIFMLQALVLVIGGSIYCLQSVQREKDQNTFDFQRVTRLSPLTLAIGKILGAPSLMYFVALCLMPVALWAGFAGGVSILIILQMYVVLFLGAFTFHAFAVLVSMILEKGTSAGAMFFFLWAIGFGAIDSNNSAYQSGPLAIHALGPFWPYNLANPATPYPGPMPSESRYMVGPTNDIFFGVSVPHVAVLIVLYLTFTACFLLALARNIKRDPSVYEIFRPIQAFAFSLYLNFLVLGFLRWVGGNWNRVAPPVNTEWVSYPVSAGAAESTFLVFSLFIFLMLGFTLLRSRERVRHIVREFGNSSVGWLTALWPSPYLFVGMFLCGGAILFMIRVRQAPEQNWSLGLGFLQVAFAGAWLARDFVYLQWMRLRRIRRPIITGLLFLIVFYTCTAVVFGALGLFKGSSEAIAAIFIPGAVFGLDLANWEAHQSQWFVTLALVLAQSLLFAWLQLNELRDLAAPKSTTVAAKT